MLKQIDEGLNIVIVFLAVKVAVDTAADCLGLSHRLYPTPEAALHWYRGTITRAAIALGILAVTVAAKCIVRRQLRKRQMPEAEESAL